MQLIDNDNIQFLQGSFVRAGPRTLYSFLQIAAWQSECMGDTKTMRVSAIPVDIHLIS